MRNSLEDLVQHYPRPYLTDTDLKLLLATGTNHSRYGKVKRLLAQGKLVLIRRGLYSIPQRFGDAMMVHPYEIAQMIYGPSYISFESALSFHQLIPERVYTITSATIKRSKEFQTPIGLFHYQHCPLEFFYCKVDRIIENGGTFFMASPWKAICDYVFCKKKHWTGAKPLVESLRIDLDQVPTLTSEDCAILENYYNNRRMSLFLQGIQQDLK
jgi:predicted transcriptional regulator of viral defense system